MVVAWRGPNPVQDFRTVVAGGAMTEVVVVVAILGIITAPALFRLPSPSCHEWNHYCRLIS